MTGHMSGRGEPALSVDLWPRVAPDPNVRVFTPAAGEHALGEIALVGDGSGLRAAVNVATDTLVAGTELAALIRALAGLARAEAAPRLTLAAGADLRLRYYARAAGFVGPVRSDLVLDLGPSPSAPAPRPAQLTRPELLLAELQALLPGVVLKLAPPGGVLRSFLRSASAGVEGTVHLAARGPSDPAPFRLALPLADDVVAEGVALTVDTALTLRRRFRPLVDRVRVFYDHAVHGLRAGTLGGVAEQGARDVHLNPAYVLISQMELLEQQQRQAAPGAREPPPPPPRTVLPPFTGVDAVVAHEFWHEIEFGFETGRYRDSVEFRQAVGRYFGVETLEHAIKGNRADAPPTWQVARGRLAEEVSAYATTAPKEATAELFKQWWCTAAAPPPSAQYFGSVLAQFFPAADLQR